MAIPNSSIILDRALQLSFKVFGLLALTAYLMICNATNLGVTNSPSAIIKSYTYCITLTSPILSDKNGIIVAVVLLFTFSQFYDIVVNNAIDSLIRLILDSFQSFIFALINLAIASIKA